MSSTSWQQRLAELAETLSDLALEMADDEGYCERGFVMLLSRSMVLSILEVCEEDDRPERIIQLLKSSLDCEIAAAIALIEKRKH